MEVLYVKMRKSVLVLLLVLVTWCLPALGDGLEVDIPSSMRPFEDKEVVVTAPEKGSLSILVSDEYGDQLPIAQDLLVEAGQTTIPYDATSYGGMPLKQGKYDIEAVLVGDSGQTHTDKTTVTMKSPVAALQYALPGSSVYYLQQKESWFMDCSITGACTINLEFYSDEAMTDKVTSVRKKMANGGLLKVTWKGKNGSKKVDPGMYWCKAYITGREDDVSTFSLEVKSGKPEELQLATTEELLPATLDDATVWQAMMQPMVVVDIDAVDHQKIYAKNTTNSEVLGMVHGQSQGLKVIEVGSKYSLVGAWRHEDGAYIEGYVPNSKLKTVTPSQHYGVLVDKVNQTLTVYEYGKPIGQMSVSTGLMAQEKLFRETRSGAFMTTDRIIAFESHGYKYDYPIRIDGGNLIHQMGYKVKGKKADFSEQIPLLGGKASEGCVRMDYRTSEESPLNAFWVWTHLEYGTKVLVLDDQENWQKRLDQLFPTADTYLPLTQAEKEGTTSVVLSLAGDCTLGSEEKTRKKDESFDSYVAEKGYDWPFSGLYDLFSTDDMTFINLECVLKDDSKGLQKDRLYNFRGPTKFTEVLIQGSIEKVNIANNHYIDYGNSGKESTTKALTDAGIPYSGFGEVYIAEINGHKIGFCGIRETVYKQKKDQMQTDIATLKELGAEIIVYSCHFGKEYSRTHNELQEKMAYEAIDAGADLVVGNHPHVVQGIEYYNDGVILYSLGNFVFGGNLNLTEFDACVVQAEMLWQGDTYLGIQLNLIPVLTTGAKPANDFRPVIAEGEDKANILKKMQNDSELTLQEQMFFPSYGI